MIDSGVLIAYAYEKDEFHKRAMEVLPEFMKRNRHITDYVVVETTNYMLRKVSFEAARKSLEQITNTNKIQVIYNDQLSFKATKEIFLKYPGLSFTDANMVFHMQRLDLKELLSFDGGFDKVREIKRVH